MAQAFFYTLPTKLWGVILVSPLLAVCLPVRLSVCGKVVSFWPTMMILHTCVDHDPTRTSDAFGVNRSKVKVIFGLQTFYHFHKTIIKLHFLLAYREDTSHTYWPWSKEDLYWFWGQYAKGQGHIWTLNFLPFLHNNSISVGIQIEWWYFTPVLTMTQEEPVLLLGSKGQRSKEVKAKLWKFEFVDAGGICPF